MSHPVQSLTALSLSANVPPLGANQAGDPSVIVTTNPVAASSVFGSEFFSPTAMSPESLMIYLKSRLGGLDKQMNDVFDREQKGEHVRAELHSIQGMLTSLEQCEKPQDEKDIASNPEDLEKFKQELNGHIDTIRQFDPKLAEELQAKLYGEGQIMWKDDARYTGAELEGTKDYLNIVSKDLDSSSQMDMIALQQQMSSRQTAIQLATNLISACGESSKAIATNIR
jgi:hypothetical protein